MKENFIKKKLKNGMTLLFEKRELPVVSLAFAVKYGGVNESLEEKGIAHFIEHMLFKGTENRTHSQIVEELEGVGGDINGFTDENITAYFAKLPSEHLKKGLDVLSDAVKNPLFDKDELEKERNVIFEEMKMIKDNPIHYSIDQIQNLLYTGSFSERLIGDEKTLNSFNRDKLVNKFREIYKSNNMVLCVVGNAELEDVERFANESFSNSENTEVDVPEQKFGRKNESKKETRKGIDQTNILFCYHVPFAGEKKSYAARALIAFMAEGMSSRLFEEIREKRNLAYAVKGGSEFGKEFAHSFVYVGTTKENVEKVKEIILEEYKNVFENFSEKELDKIKERLIGNFKISTEDSSHQMIHLLYSEVGSDASDFYDFEKNVSEVSLDEIKEIAKNAYDKHSFFVLEPEE